ncbi:MAG: ribonuclease catalytic domain-containing protein [Candidatus Gracilibacteria bacterium]|nr:ribonuclease catalytic domain-containing protein [Candidatus Gracilibacteria bacterium]
MSATQLIPSVSTHIPFSYSKSALKELNIIEKNFNKILKKEMKLRKRFDGITIDQACSKDLDDGFWGYRDGENHVIQVSIADIAELILRSSHLDNEALNRATSVYLMTHVLHMFPELISTNFASLNHKKYRLALTVEITLDKNYDVIKIEIVESIFYNRNRLDYEIFDKILSNSNHELNKDILYLLEVAKNLGEKRKNLDFSDDDRKICLDNECSDKKTEILYPSPSFLVQEIMILTNRCVAKWLVDNGIYAMFRNHMPEYKGLEFSGMMERAVYNPKMSHHYALGLDFYCHFTSPIRRYADLIVHRQIKAFINPLKNKSYKFSELNSLSLYINEQIYALKQLQMKKEKLDNEKRFERKLKKILEEGEKVDLSRISIHTFQSIIEYILENDLEIPEIMFNEILKRIDDNLINKEIYFKLFFYSKSNLISNRVYFDIKTKYYVSHFYNFLKKNDFEIIHSFDENLLEDFDEDDFIYHFSIQILHKGEIIVEKELDSDNIQNGKRNLILSSFDLLKEWRDNVFFKKKETKKLGFIKAFFLFKFQNLFLYFKYF